MNFERGKSVKDSMELGIMTKLEKYAPDIFRKYHNGHMSDNSIKEMEDAFKEVLGISVKVIYEENDHGSSVTVKIGGEPSPNESIVNE